MAIELAEDNNSLGYAADIEQAFRRTVTPVFLSAISRADMKATFDQQMNFGQRYAAFTAATYEFLAFAEQRGARLIAVNTRIGYLLGVVGM